MNKNLENRIKKKVAHEVKEEKNEIKEIWERIKTRNFSGTTGLVIKNSIYQFSTNLSAKVGAFIFTIILARLLLPEMFGLYTLTLSTILVFGAFSELGIETTLTRFVSRELGKKKRKIKTYLIYLGKIKLALTFVSAILILVLAGYIANNFYQKPIFLALLAGILYIVFNQISGFLKSMLQASDHFSSIFKREIIFQIARIVLVPTAVILSIRHSLSDATSLMLIILLLSLSLFLASLFLFFDIKKIYINKIKKEKKALFSKKEKNTVNKFLFATAALVLSGAFFGNIDKVMLGRFVQSEFIGYYTASTSLIGALISLTGFAAVVLLPIFSKLKGKRLDIGFKKSIRITLLLSTAMFLAVLAFANLAVLIIYGRQYLLATNILRVLSPLLFALPVIAIYQSYFISQGNPQRVTKLLIATTIINIILNYILITSLLPYGNLAAVYGVGIATLISQGVYLGGLILGRKKN